MKKQNSMPKSPQADDTNPRVVAIGGGTLTRLENTASETAASVKELLKAITEIKENLKVIRRTVTGGF